MVTHNHQIAQKSKYSGKSSAGYRVQNIHVILGQTGSLQEEFGCLCKPIFWAASSSWYLQTIFDLCNVSPQYCHLQAVN